VQVGSAVGLWAVGRYVVAPAADQPRTNKYSEVGFDLIRAQILSQSLVHGMKYSVRRNRPTGECCAFPSGHSATAFAAASVLERHFGYRASWPALAAATYVATSRLVDNRHFVSDVAFGAALVHRRSLGDAVLAHATTNGLIACYVFYTGHWSIWS